MLALAFLSFVGFAVYRSSPVWVQDSLFQKHTIRLLPLGAAVMYANCDVCPGSIGYAIWKDTGDFLLIRSLGSKNALRLRRVSEKPCVTYMEEDAYRRLHGYNPLSAYAQLNDPGCPNGAPAEIMGSSSNSLERSRDR